MKPAAEQERFTQIVAMTCGIDTLIGKFVQDNIKIAMENQSATPMLAERNFNTHAEEKMNIECTSPVQPLSPMCKPSHRQRIDVQLDLIREIESKVISSDQSQIYPWEVNSSNEKEET